MIANEKYLMSKNKHESVYKVFVEDELLYPSFKYFH